MPSHFGGPKGWLKCAKHQTDWGFKPYNSNVSGNFNTADRDRQTDRQSDRQSFLHTTLINFVSTLGTT